jgi:hypothetical protein
MGSDPTVWQNIFRGLTPQFTLKLRVRVPYPLVSFTEEKKKPACRPCMRANQER